MAFEIALRLHRDDRDDDSALAARPLQLKLGSTGRGMIISPRALIFRMLFRSPGSRFGFATCTAMLGGSRLFQIDAQRASFRNVLRFRMALESLYYEQRLGVNLAEIN